MGRHTNTAQIQVSRAVHRENYNNLTWHGHQRCSACSYEGRHRA